MSTAVAIVLLLAFIAYAIFAGADFGAGFWGFISRGGSGQQARGVIEHSIGPVWEANHVWLIFILVVLWTGFSDAYASIMLTLFVPLTIVALGIVLRGASFAFGKAVTAKRERRIFVVTFGVSSLLVPYCMGTVVGGIASGRVPAGGQAGDPVDSWINPTSVLVGLLAVAAVAYLAAVYLAWDSRRLGDAKMTDYFRKGAIGAGVAVALIAFPGLLVLRADARYVFDGLTSRALPFVILSAVCGACALLLLMRSATRGARLLAVVAVASVIIAWAVAQWPYLLPTSLTVEAAAAPSGTLTALVIVAVLAVLIVLPGFLVLYVLDQKGLLPDEGVPDVSDQTTNPAGAGS